MKVIITGRHLKLDDDIRSYAEEKMRKAETFFDRIIEGHMTLSAEKHRRIAEVTLKAKRAVFYAQEETENVYASIDGVMEKVETQIKRYKEKLTDRKHQHDHYREAVYAGTTSGAQEVSDDREELKPEIVKVDKFASEPLTVHEAVMQMVLSGDDLLMFSNSQTNQINVVYRRKDGSYGWIEPNFR